MLNIKYPVTEDRKTLIFKFFSEGPKGTIEKRIIYYKTKIPNVYALGFGDKTQSVAGIDDFIVTNNGDTKKVLATVASTLYTFTEWFPNASIVAKGSTRSRNRLYRMNISNNYDLIQADFEIFGRKNGQWIVFEKNTDYDAFLAKRKAVNLSI